MAESETDFLEVKESTNSTNKKAALTQGNIGSTLTKLTFQMLVGILGIHTFNLVDTFFVGQLGANELAAMGFTFPVILVVNSIALGLGIGASAVISRAIGEGNQYRVQRLTTDALFLSFIIVTIFVIIGLFTIEPIFRQLGASPEILILIKSYMKIWYIGMPFVVIPMVGNNAIRATGDTKTPSLIMITAVLVNITLDPLFIFGYGPFPRLELVGAATATVIARAITFTLALWILYRREKMISLAIPQIKEMLNSWKKILYIGLPAAGTTLIMPVSAGIVTRLVSTYGVASVAGFGVASRVEMFSLAIIGALSSVLTPFVGQNWGAQKQYRVQKGVKFSFLFSLGWGLIVFTVFVLAAKPIAQIFNDNPEVVATTSLYLIIVSVSYGLLGSLMLSASTFNALNKPLHSSLVMIIRLFVLYVPLAFIGARFFQITGIFGASALANLISGLLAILWIRKTISYIKEL